MSSVWECQISAGPHMKTIYICTDVLILHAFWTTKYKCYKTDNPYLFLKTNDSVALSGSETWSHWCCLRTHQDINHQAYNLKFLKSFCKSKTKLHHGFRHKLLTDEGFETGGFWFPWDLMVPKIFSKVSALLKGEIAGLDMSFNSKRKMGWYLRTDSISDSFPGSLLLSLMECTMFKWCFAFPVSFLHFLLYPLRKRKEKINGKRERQRLLLCGIQKRGEKRSVIRNTLKIVVTNFCEVGAANFNNSYIKHSVFSLLIHTSFILLGWDIKTCAANQNYRAAKQLHSTAFTFQWRILRYLQPFRKTPSGRAGSRACPLCLGDQWMLTTRRYKMGLFAVLHLLDWAWSQPGKLCEEQLCSEAEQASHSQALPKLHQIHTEYPCSWHQALFFQHKQPWTEVMYYFHLSHPLTSHSPHLTSHEAPAWPLPQPGPRVTLWAALPFAASP